MAPPSQSAYRDGAPVLDRVVTLAVVTGLSAATFVMGFVAVGNLPALIAYL